MAVAYSYVRFSTPAQSLGDSARRQVEAAEYAATRGLTLDTTMRDEGLSGYAGEHVAGGALGRFLARVRVLEVPAGATLIVEAMDRLSRQDVVTALSQFLDLIKAGIAVVTLMDQRRYDLASVNSNPMELQYSIMLMAAANTESTNKAKRLRDVWTQKRSAASAKTAPLSRGACPGWLSWGPNGWVIDDAKVATITRILIMLAEGHGVMLVARALNLDGVPLLSRGKRGSGRWAPSTIRYVASNDQLIGRYQPHTGRGGKNRKPVGDPIEGYFPSVVPAELLARARAATAERRNAGAGRKGHECANLLSRIARCASCSSPMAFIRGTGRSRPTYLRCARALRGAGCAAGDRAHYGRLEAALLDRVAPAVLEGPAGDGVEAALAERLVRVRGEAEAARAAAKRLTDRIANDPDAPATIMDGIRAREATASRFDAEAVAITREIEALSARIPKAELYETVRRLAAEARNETLTPEAPTAARLHLQSALRGLLEVVEVRGPYWRAVTKGGWATLEHDADHWRVRGDAVPANNSAEAVEAANELNRLMRDRFGPRGREIRNRVVQRTR
jgi:DNA invertase Pin-like site-specific DNA recombinase